MRFSSGAGTTRMYLCLSVWLYASIFGNYLRGSLLRTYHESADQRVKSPAQYNMSVCPVIHGTFKIFVFILNSFNTRDGYY